MRDENTSWSYILLRSQNTTKAIRHLCQKTMTTKKEEEEEEEGKTTKCKEHHFSESKEAKTS